MEKRGDISLSFGMIISVIIIAAIMGVAVYVIIQFLGTKECTELGLYGRDLQTRVDSAWRADSAERQTFTSNVPTGVDKVCFGDLDGSRDAPEFRELRNYVGEDVNLFFYPRVDCDLTAIKIEHVAPRDFYCVDVVSGKATFELNKGSFESLVKVCAPNDSACRAASGAPASTGSSSSGSGNTTTVPTSGNALPQVSRQWCEQADSGDVCEALNDESIGGQNNYKEACCHYYQKCC